MHQLVAGSGNAVVDYADVPGDGIRLIVDEAAEIDAVRRSVAPQGGGSVAFDYLIYAVGSRGVASSIPGAIANARSRPCSRLRVR
ncbi:hypothetical protein JMUB6875_60910 [Nocardia sp. JMUB6875]|uniref:hypothetical protein n=1 Tax=Nocardia sp. JMUB6875 TaxID=3158170 RepID=UPI0032E5B8FD